MNVLKPPIARLPRRCKRDDMGLVRGWPSLVGGGPFTVPSRDTASKYQKIIIRLSDGLNTQDRWSGNGRDTSSDVDNRMYQSSTGAGDIAAPSTRSTAR